MNNAKSVSVEEVKRSMNVGIPADSIANPGPKHRALDVITDALRDCIGIASKNLQAEANAELSALLAALAEYEWLKAHPDEFVSAVDDAYGGWDGEDPADFADILADEVAHQRSKYP